MYKGIIDEWGHFPKKLEKIFFMIFHIIPLEERLKSKATNIQILIMESKSTSN